METGVLEVEPPGLPARPAERARGGPNGDRKMALLMLAPNLVLFTLFIAVPIVGGVALSFTNWDLVGVPQFAGLANYDRLIHDPMVPQAVKTTVIFIALGVTPTVFIGLLLAMLVNIKFRFVSVVRTLYFVPAVVSFAASAVLWQWMFRPGQGLIDYLLYQVGVTGPAWLSDTTWALPALDIVTIWLSLPAAILLYLGALQRIPESVIEAALLDGAGPWTRLRRIVWPAVQNVTIIVVIFTLLTFSNGSFDLVNILTQGGPIDSTTTLIYYTYYVGFQNIQLGYAAALGILQLALIGAMVGALRLVGRWAQR